MKLQEFHLLNRIYIYPPGKKILPYFGEPEDVITPEKVQVILDELDAMTYDKTTQNAILQFQLPKKYKGNIERHTIYVMTKQREMFQTLKDLNYEDEEAIFDWLIHYWNVCFLMTFPVYFNEALACTFHIKTRTFEQCSYSYDYFIEHKLYTIGNGMTLLLSLNAAGQVSNEITWNVFHRFIEKIDYNDFIVDIHYQWAMYYSVDNRHIAFLPFLYAFQYCDPIIYELLCLPSSNTMCFINQNNENVYFSSMFTTPLFPQKHHYDFLKKTRQSWVCIQTINNSFHFNIHQRLLAILQSSSSVRAFLSNDLSRRFLIHCIYKNKRLGLLKFIQSIAYLYHNHIYSKRYLKLIWRNIMCEFKKDFIKMMHIYLLEYFLLESNAKSSYSLLCPPLKMLRDEMYILKEHFSLHNKINFSLIIAKKYKPYLDSELFYCPQEIRSSHNKYILDMSFLQIIKLIKPYHPPIEYYIQRMEKKRMTLLQCCHKKSYEIYQVMQEYYRHQPDALWKV